jgi:hypothetical protein
MKDTLLGECTVEAGQVTNGQTLQYQYPLQTKDNSAAGTLVVDVATYTDLGAV